MPENNTEEDTFLDLLIANKEHIFEFIPFSKNLGMEIVELSRGTAHLQLAYADALIGDPETGVVHGGVLTSLLDSVSGMAVFTLLDMSDACATLDLRIDYMKPATPGQTLHTFAECYKRTGTIAFVRATAYHDTADDPIATSSAAFMITSRAARSDQKGQNDG